MKKYFKYYKCTIVTKEKEEIIYGNSNQIKHIVKNEIKSFPSLNKKDKMLIKNKLSGQLQKINKKINDNLNVNNLTFRHKNIQINLFLKTLVISEKSKTIINNQGEVIYFKRNLPEINKRFLKEKKELLTNALKLANEIVDSISFLLFIKNCNKTSDKNEIGFPKYKFKNFELVYTITRFENKSYFEFKPLFQSLKKDNKTILSSNDEFLLLNENFSLKKQKKVLEEVKNAVMILQEIEKKLI